jgi:hypothetical protein
LPGSIASPNKKKPKKLVKNSLPNAFYYAGGSLTALPVPISTDGHPWARRFVGADEFASTALLYAGIRRLLSLRGNLRARLELSLSQG